MGRMWWAGLEGSFWEQGLPSTDRAHLEYFHRRSVHNIQWPVIPIQDCSYREGILASSDVTPMLVNLESVTTKPRLRAMENRESHVLFCTYVLR